MYLERLYLYQFRNCSQVDVHFSPGVNYIVGKNAQGKTNILEAIYLLGATRSFRTSSKSDFIAWGAEEASIMGNVQQVVSDISLRIVYSKRKRILELNGDTVSNASDFAGRLLCVSFFPGDLQIVKGAPLERRRFLDKHIVDLNPSMLSVFMEYSHALKNKNALLKRGEQDRDRLYAWNMILARKATQIIQARVDFLKALHSRVNAVHQDIVRSDVEVHCHLDSEWLHEGDVPFEEQEILDVLMELIPKEHIVKRSLKGPHRDDIRILLDGHDARSFASQGQSRSLVLALKIAVVHLLESCREDSPIVLLDDVDSELDSVRRQGLFDSLLEGNRQIILSGTDVAERLVEAKSDIQFLRISDGQLSSSQTL